MSSKVKRPARWTTILSPSSVHSRTEPGPTPSLRRTSAGTEICPWAVNFDRAMAIATLYYHGNEPMNRNRWIVVLLVCLAVSLACVVYPIYVIRPFRAQGARELMAALEVSRFRPLLTVISALVAVWAAIVYWRA